MVNRALAAHFGLASWFSSVVHSLDTSRPCRFFFGRKNTAELSEDRT